ncbi:hypothetical protein EDC01DRAFT_629296 [Geopyxis carbonaria]|nr:hypothetical protein EDC01DRAFT_629296 [Geopyxis carbonaria]
MNLENNSSSTSPNPNVNRYPHARRCRPSASTPTTDLNHSPAAVPEVSCVPAGPRASARVAALRTGSALRSGPAPRGVAVRAAITKDKQPAAARRVVKNKKPASTQRVVKNKKPSAVRRRKDAKNPTTANTATTIKTAAGAKQQPKGNKRVRAPVVATAIGSRRSHRVTTVPVRYGEWCL